jgi:hypothetical protein
MFENLQRSESNLLTFQISMCQIWMKANEMREICQSWRIQFELYGFTYPPPKTRCTVPLVTTDLEKLFGGREKLTINKCVATSRYRVTLIKQPPGEQPTNTWFLQHQFHSARLTSTEKKSPATQPAYHPSFVLINAANSPRAFLIICALMFSRYIRQRLDREI